MHDAADSRALVIVQLLVESAVGERAAVGHEILADVAAGIRQAGGKLVGRGEQQKPRSFGAVGGKNHGFGFLQVGVALGIEIGGADHATVLVGLDAADVTVGANFATAGFFGHGNYAGERSGLRADFATEAKAEAAIHAGGAAGARLGQNRQGRGICVIAELAATTFEDDAVSLHRKRWHRIGLGARRVERAGAREARDANFPLNLGVVRLEVGVADRPVGKVGAWNVANLAVFLEIDFVEAPEVGGEVDAAAADATAI